MKSFIRWGPLCSVELQTKQLVRRFFWVVVRPRNALRRVDDWSLDVHGGFGRSAQHRTCLDPRSFKAGLASSSRGRTILSGRDIDWSTASSRGEKLNNVDDLDQHRRTVLAHLTETAHWSTTRRRTPQLKVEICGAACATCSSPPLLSSSAPSSLPQWPGLLVFIFPGAGSQTESGFKS